jgi:hypothetical protein
MRSLACGSQATLQVVNQVTLTCMRDVEWLW